MAIYEKGGPAPTDRVLAAGRVLDFLLDLQNEMSARGIHQADLARRIGVERSQISRWLAGESGLTARSMFLLARGIGCELNYEFVDFTEENGAWETVPTNVIQFRTKSNVQIEGLPDADGGVQVA